MTSFISFVFGIGMLVLLFLGGRAIYRHFFGTDYSKPWWTGTATLKVCQTNGNEKCYSLPVVSDGDKVTRAEFPNGGYLVANYPECAEAASSYNFKSFCSFTDQESRTWDVVPLGANN